MQLWYVDVYTFSIIHIFAALLHHAGLSVYISASNTDTIVDGIPPAAVVAMREASEIVISMLAIDTSSIDGDEASALARTHSQVVSECLRALTAKAECLLEVEEAASGFSENSDLVFIASDGSDNSSLARAASIDSNMAKTMSSASQEHGSALERLKSIGQSSQSQGTNPEIKRIYRYRRLHR